MNWKSKWNDFLTDLSGCDNKICILSKVLDFAYQLHSDFGKNRDFAGILETYFFPYKELSLVNYAYDCTWLDIKEEVHYLSLHKADSFSSTMSSLHHFFYNMLVFKSDNECPNCQQDYLRAWNAKESIYFECDVCCSFYDSMLNLCEGNGFEGILIPCDANTIKRHKLVGAPR